MSKRVFYISGPQRNLQPGYWLYDYLKSDGYFIISYYNRKDDNEVITKYIRFKRLLFNSLSVLFRARKEDMILVYDHDYSGYVLSFLIWLFRPYLTVLKINQMGGNKSHLFPTHLRFLASRGFKNMYTTCNNKKIGSLFSKELKIPQTHFIPIPDSISDFGSELLSIKDKEEENYIFMGGATHRDYALFVECARHMPEYNFVAVTFEKYKSYFEAAPRNVKVFYGLLEKDFYKMIAHSNVVFVPLTNDLQGGQMVIFQAALLGKAIVTTQNEAIGTYFDENDIVVISIGSLKEATDNLQRLMSDKKQRITLGTSANEAIRKFTTEEIYKQYKQLLFVKANHL